MTGSKRTSLPPILIRGLLDAPSLFRGLVEQHAPYLPVQRYFASAAEYRMSSGRGDGALVAPNFRGDWAYDQTLVDGAELFLGHPKLAEAARELFGAACVRPFAVYTNLTWQLPFHQGGGHTDVPAFRGVDRTRYPIWFLSVMGHSGLFEEERIPIATAVAWFYEGSDGGFEYWPDGPDAPSRIHEGDIYNDAIVGDNDRMYHRVRPVGCRRDGLISGMTLDTRLEHVGGDAWRIANGGETLAELPYDRLRISVSWKAEVFPDADARRVVDEHADDLTEGDVLARFHADLDARGIPCDPPAEPLVDPDFVDLLSRTYVEAPDSPL